MNTIRNIALHHSGGLANNNRASTRHLTFNDVNQHHRQKWNFPSLFFNNSWAGYNVIYDPKIRQFKQFRAIGEETAAQKGSNHDTFSLCVIGNYLTDEMERYIEDDISKFLNDLMDGNKSNLLIAPNTRLDFSVTRIYPHKFFSQTECNGLDNEWGRRIVLREKQIVILQQMILLYSQILDALRRGQFAARDRFGSDTQDRECSGMMS